MSRYAETGESRSGITFAHDKLGYEVNPSMTNSARLDLAPRCPRGQEGMYDNIIEKWDRGRLAKCSLGLSNEICARLERRDAGLARMLEESPHLPCSKAV